MTTSKSHPKKPRRWRREDQVVFVSSATGKFAQIASAVPLDGRSREMRTRSALIESFALQLDPVKGFDGLSLFTREIVKRLATMALQAQIWETSMLVSPEKVSNEDRLAFSTAQSNFDRLARSIGLIKDARKISVKEQKKLDAKAAMAELHALAAKSTTAAHKTEVAEL